MWKNRDGTSPPQFRVGCCGLFFFQAEDGIRDIGVTGVQTCALPIYLSTPGELRFTARGGALRVVAITGTPAEVLERYTRLTGRAPLPPIWAFGFHQSRSEERRVGKEGRARARGGHYAEDDERRHCEG